MAAFLDRIEAVNPSINAIVSLRPRDELLAEVRAAGAEDLFRGRGYEFAHAARAADNGVEIRARHRCGQRMLIPFGELELVSNLWAAALVVERLRSFVDVGCLCEVVIVTDHDRGDEDGGRS